MNSLLRRSPHSAEPGAEAQVRPKVWSRALSMRTPMHGFQSPSSNNLHRQVLSEHSQGTSDKATVAQRPPKQQDSTAERDRGREHGGGQRACAWASECCGSHVDDLRNVRRFLLDLCACLVLELARV